VVDRLKICEKCVAACNVIVASLDVALFRQD